MNISDRYDVVLGSDVARDGMFLELWERAPSELVLWAFYSDADGSMEFEQYRQDMPAEVRMWFEQEARRRLPPSIA